MYGTIATCAVCIYPQVVCMRVHLFLYNYVTWCTTWIRYTSDIEGVLLLTIVTVREHLSLCWWGPYSSLFFFFFFVFCIVVCSVFTVLHLYYVLCLLCLISWQCLCVVHSSLYWTLLTRHVPLVDTEFSPFRAPEFAPDLS